MKAWQDALYFAVFFDIKSEHVESFRGALIEECCAVEALEAKTARFNLWQSRTDASRWLVLEAFREREGLEEHRRMPHYLKVRAQLEGWQRSPRSHDAGYSLVLF